MSLPSFATLERSLANANVTAFANRIMLKGTTQFPAIIDRSLNPLGEYDLTQVRQDRMTISLAAAPALAIGDTVSLDPAYYTAPELAAEPKTSWTLDRKGSDDGLVAEWWLR